MSHATVRRSSASARPTTSPARRDVSLRRPRPRGRVPGARRRPHDDGRHRRRRARQGPRPVRGRDEARAVPVRRARRDRQADVPGAHRRFGRRHDRHRRRVTTSRPASTSACSRSRFEKQSEGNAQFALGSGQGRRRSAPAARSRRSSAAYIHRSGAPEHIGWKVAVKDRQNALKNPYAHLKIEDISIEKVQGVADDVGADPLPRVVPVVRRRVRGRAHRRGRAARPPPPTAARRRGSSAPAVAQRAVALPRPRPGAPAGARVDCAADVYAPGRHHQPARADRHGRALRAVLAGTRRSGSRATTSPSPARAGR